MSTEPSRTMKAAFRAGATAAGTTRSWLPCSDCAETRSSNPSAPCSCSGMGSTALPGILRTYGFHGIHGRALPIAEGVKMARPDLHVFVNAATAIAAASAPPTGSTPVTETLNLTVMMHDDFVYGLTKKQASPTSPRGLKSNTTPRGSYLRGAQSSLGHARRAERVVRRAGRRLDPRGALPHCPGGVHT